jgi:hypothetical protein
MEQIYFHRGGVGMADRKLNCWEFVKCGREPGGENVNELGVCPSSVSERHDGLNGGTQGGRYCWAITGTFCEGEVQGTFPRKMGKCSNCDFYRTVELEEGRQFVVYVRMSDF